MPENTADSPEKQLANQRQQIDQIDSQLLRLINQRADCAHFIGQLKSTIAARSAGSSGEDPAANSHARAQLYRPEREAEVLRRLQKLNPGPLGNEQVAFFFRELMSACLSLEAPLQIAYLGPPGSFSAAAAQKHFGHAALYSPFESIDDIFRETETGRTQYAVIPLENSSEGSVGRSMDLLLNTPLKVCGEVILRIHQNLMSSADKIEDVKKIYSHTQSLAQCHEWLNLHLPGVERVAVASNSLAAELATAELKTAAIAGQAAAERYKLNVLADNIEDEPNNTTRFVVLGMHDVPPSGEDKTSLILAAPNQAGSLIRMLTAFSEVNISMTRLESRPSKEMLWEYVFHIDIEGHQEDMRCQMAFKLLSERAAFVKILGSYPQALY